MIGHNPSVPTNQPIVKNGSYLMSQEATTMFGFANNEDEAKLMNISRGFTQAYIFDRYKGVFYYKQIDPNTCQVIVFKTFGYDEIVPPEPAKPVTHEDLANLKNDIVAQFAALINTTKKEDEVCG